MDLSLLNENTPLEIINELTKDSLLESLGITFTKVKEGLVEGKIGLSAKNSRPGGVLHGGANLALAETVAGLGSMVLVDMSKYNVLGMSVTANHTGVLKEGHAIAVAKIIHQGNRTHVWNVDITNEEGKLISTARVTNMIVKIKNDK